MSLQSALYEGTIRHRRFKPRENSFQYGLALFYLDLAELPQIFRLPGLLAFGRRALLSFNRADYYGDPARSIDECVRELVEARCGRRPVGPIRLLTQISYLGYCFNPVSFYYCFDAAGEKLEFVVAEVTNTPWGRKTHRSFGSDTRRTHRDRL